MNRRNLLKAGAALGLSLVTTGGVLGIVPGAAAALMVRPTPTCVYVVDHVAPKGGYAGFTLVRNRCPTSRYVKITYTNPQARVGSCLRADSTHSFSLPWKYGPYRGAQVKAVSEQPKTC
jgi:hypothetical protein